jgi:hypothetical protein
MEETTQRQGPAAPKLGGCRYGAWLQQHGGGRPRVVCSGAPVWLRSGGSADGEGVLHFSGRRCSMAWEMVAVLALMIDVGVNLSGTTRMGLDAGE